MHITSNYSPNFDLHKRISKEIKFIVFHYTGMKNETDAINKLTNYKSKVSSHYFIKKNGEILTLIPDLYIAWHAGFSNWKNYKSINRYSIGIEISNPGHQYKYNEFNKKQIISLIKLSKFLIKKYRIKFKNILGHSDISPDRKKDPGEKFPWKHLSRNKIGYWHDLSQNQISRERNKKVDQKDKKVFIQNLYKIGYTKNLSKKKLGNSKILTTAFQRRFRQELINGKIDKECLIISTNLKKKIK